MAEAKRGSLGKGDLVRPRMGGGHVMSVMRIDAVNRKVITSYTTPDGVRHDEEWSAGDLKRAGL